MQPAGRLTLVLGPVNNLLAFALLLLAGCANSGRMGLAATSSLTAALVPARCENGDPATTFWSVRSMLTGEHLNLMGPNEFSGTVFLKPGNYQLEAGCNRGVRKCGLGRGFAYVDGAPTLRIKAASSSTLFVDCDPSSGAPFIIGPGPN